MKLLGKVAATISGINPKVWIILVTAITAAVYLFALPSGFVLADDPQYIFRNALVAHPSLAAIFSPYTLTADDWTPLVTLSFAAEHFFFGMDPLVFHLDNLLLHCAAVVLVWRVLSVFGFSDATALFAALIFGIHPLQVESVAWLSGRKNLLAGVFSLGYLIEVERDRRWNAAALLVLALLSKGTAVALPLLAVTLLLIRRDAKTLKVQIPFFLVTVALCVARGALSLYAQAAITGARTGIIPLTSRMAIMVTVVARQLRQFVAPYDLTFMYMVISHNWFDWTVIGSGVIVGFIAIAGAAAPSNRFRLALALAILPFLPTANIIPSPWFQADRYVYLSIIGVAAFFISALFESSRNPVWQKWIVALWIAAVLVPQTQARILVWQNDKNLWTDVVTNNPQNALAWNNLGIAYVRAGDSNQALSAFEQSLKAEPSYPDASFNRDHLLATLGQK